MNITNDIRTDITNYFTTQDSELFVACQQHYGAAMWGSWVNEVSLNGLDYVMQVVPATEVNPLKEAAKGLTKEFLDALVELETLNQQMKDMKEREQALRVRIFGACFENPVEGTNNFPLPAGYVLKFTHKINRIVDASVLQSVREELETLKVNMDDVIKFKPELAVGTYKKLTPEAKLVMDKAVTSKPGTPSYEIVLPKKSRA